ncbi:hypothetical protein D0Z07_0074 [Hyphodiscus hymeniophilus]|uniref:Uncharacterized protein n=1 Tax=Hyphodiscus hymeniophilus TaxID=353542 RepID=A0A9P6VQI0_9HELO|nr:hypothetical protein D0Z07_0074 [Hyphodiscus hymeniophilus]
MSISSNPTQKDPERAFALQKYLLLHSQHDALQKHLSQITTSVPATADTSPSQSPSRYGRHSSVSSDSYSLSSSPETPPNMHVPRNLLPSPSHQRSSSVAYTPSRPPMRKRRSSLPTNIDENTIGEIEEDETKLKVVNQQIKTTLTELLNCASALQDVGADETDGCGDGAEEGSH